MTTTTPPNLFTDEAFAKYVKREMRKRKVTIKALSQSSGITMKRIREVRNTGKVKWQWEWKLMIEDAAKAPNN